jgi:hypothetical protein
VIRLPMPQSAPTVTKLIATMAIMLLFKGLRYFG